MKPKIGAFINYAINHFFRHRSIQGILGVVDNLIGLSLKS